MPYEVAPSSLDHRERIVTFLAFLTSEACLDACRRHVAPERLAAALTRLWFDEIYVPGTHYLDGLKGDRTQEAVQDFEGCFTEDELATLERFHGFFELRIEMAVNRVQGRAAFPDNDSWRSLIRDAAALLDDLDPDPERLRSLLARLVKQVAADAGGEALLTVLRRPRLLS